VSFSEWENLTSGNLQQVWTLDPPKEPPLTGGCTESRSPLSTPVVSLRAAFPLDLIFNLVVKKRPHRGQQTPGFFSVANLLKYLGLLVTMVLFLIFLFILQQIVVLKEAFGYKGVGP